MRYLLTVVFLVGCGPAVLVPVKVGKAVTPPVVKPIVTTTAKATGYTIAEVARLPVRIVKDTAKPAKHVEKKTVLIRKDTKKDTKKDKK